MSRYIDADAVSAELRDMAKDEYFNMAGASYSTIFEIIAEAIDKMPSAQPEIIRCKECLWRIGRDCTRFTDLPVYMDDYCGRAKRRGEQDEVN